MSEVTHEGPLPNHLPFFKNGWTGAILEHDGVPVGTFRINCRKGSKLITSKPMTAEQVENFDPDAYWKATS